MTGSITSVKGFPGFSVYAASKATLLAFARGWLNELKGRNIRVNVLVPGQVATPILEQVFDEETTRHPPSCHVAALILAVAKFSRLTRGGSTSRRGGASPSAGRAGADCSHGL
jgi:NAD(P)-dependent dehydrogenase (short-subunit alcohol dehydrogenase family)